MTSSIAASDTNLCMIWGCRPDKGLLAKSKMMEELATRMLTRHSKLTFELLMPQAFNDMAGKDANFEILTS